MGTDGKISFAPVTSRRLDDLDRFSRSHGKFRYCSCMRWRVASGDFERLGKDGRVTSLASLARSDQPVGVLGYRGDDPVAWCSVAPRQQYSALLRSRSIPTLDGERVWSLVCFFLDPTVRGGTLRRQLLDAAVDYATKSGAGTVEAYPWPGGKSYFYMGPRDLYLEAGFIDVAVPEGCRPIMRRLLT